MKSALNGGLNLSIRGGVHRHTHGVVEAGERQHGAIANRWVSLEIRRLPPSESLWFGSHCGLDPLSQAPQ